jgi:hypothetical protein
MAKKKSKNKKGLMGKLAGSGAILEIPMMADLYTDAGLALGGLGEQLMNLGIFKEGGSVSKNKKSPRGCGKALRGYGKAMKGKKQ